MLEQSVSGSYWDVHRMPNSGFYLLVERDFILKKGGSYQCDKSRSSDDICVFFEKTFVLSFLLMNFAVSIEMLCYKSVKHTDKRFKNERSAAAMRELIIYSLLGDESFYLINNMVKKFLLLACIGFATGAFAQQNINWEAQAGLNCASAEVGSSKIGFHVGVRANKEFPSVAKGFYGNVGAFISAKGFTLDYALIETDASAYYLDIPVHVGYKKALNDKFALFGEAGPYLSYGLGGTAKVTTTIPNLLGGGIQTTTESSGFFKTTDRFAYGVGVRVGMEFKQKYTASIAYDNSLSNDFNNLMLTVGYKF